MSVLPCPGNRRKRRFELLAYVIDYPEPAQDFEVKLAFHLQRVLRPCEKNPDVAGSASFGLAAVMQI